MHCEKGLLHYTCWMPRKKKEAFVPGKQTEDFTKFIQETCEIMRGELCDWPSFFICDNAAFHNDEKIKQMLNAQGDRHKLLKLPPYSPDLNPIENCFGIWKAAVRRKGVKNTAELLARIKEASAVLTP